MIIDWHYPRGGKRWRRVTLLEPSKNGEDYPVTAPGTGLLVMEDLKVQNMTKRAPTQKNGVWAMGVQWRPRQGRTQQDDPQ